MISKPLAKLIKSLQIKKHRKHNQLFVVEGLKSVHEVLNSNFKVRILLGTEKFFEECSYSNCERYTVNSTVLKSLGVLSSNCHALALVEMQRFYFSGFSPNKYSIVLDNINDPGNLGTIIRIADWYGIDTVIASPQTADFYNPKVILSTMGSFTRVNFYQCDIVNMLQKTCLKKYGAVMDGQNIYKTEFESSGIIVMGSESHGISPTVDKLLDFKVTIPSIGQCDSLNVAIAMGIFCDNISRKNW